MPAPTAAASSSPTTEQCSTPEQFISPCLNQPFQLTIILLTAAWLHGHQSYQNILMACPIE